MEPIDNSPMYTVSFNAVAIKNKFGVTYHFTNEQWQFAQDLIRFVAGSYTDGTWPKINAIKWLRSRFGLELAYAKVLIEAAHEAHFS